MKIERHSKILQLINQYEIETQEELVNKLTDAGFYVTQATISRDIRELKLTKVSVGKGKQKYIVLPNKEVNLHEKYIRIMKDGYVSMEPAGNLLILKTGTGMANAVAAALDAIEIQEIIGSIAGDDTIFCATKDNDDVLLVMDRINRILN